MRHIACIVCISLLPVFSLQAQIEQVSVGAGYAQFTYYSLEDGNTLSYSHDQWDIAFAIGGAETGIFVNEGVGISRRTVLPEVILYSTTSRDFAAVDTSSMQRVYNNELNWEEGAFNHVKAEANPFDMGWGTYNMSTHQVEGTRIFVIQLRTGTLKKLQILSLAEGVYSFRYANLDGSEERSQQVRKADFEGKTLAYYSFVQDSVMDLEPKNWDLLFTRYATPLATEDGSILSYNVTGVLSNQGIQVAQITDTEARTQEFIPDGELFTDSIAAIGHDWKRFDLDIMQWVIPLDRSYYIKTASEAMWKVKFIDFEGGTTGVSTLEKTRLDVTTSVDASLEIAFDFTLYPNPVQNHLTVELAQNDEQPLTRLRVVNPQGQVLIEEDMRFVQGANELVLDIPRGVYYLAVEVAGHWQTQSFVKL